MKLLVDAVQVLVVAAIIYPMFYVWDTTKVDQFCDVVEAGMSKHEFVQLADSNLVKITSPEDDALSGKWRSSVVTYSPFSSYSCEVVGLGNKVSSAWIMG